MDVPSLLPHLLRKRLIRMSECERLGNEQVTEKRNLDLLMIIPKKGENAVDRFLECLKNADEHSGHEHLVKVLEARINKLMPSSDV